MQKDSLNKDRKTRKEFNQFNFYGQNSEESEEEEDSEGSFDYPGKKKRKHGIEDKRGLYLTQVNKEKY